MQPNGPSLQVHSRRMGAWEKDSETTVGVRKGCRLSLTLFNIFLIQIMSDALVEYDGKTRVGSRNITSLRFLMTKTL